MKNRLTNHIFSIRDIKLQETCETILAYPKFLTWPASLSFHHAYEGGLLAHTVEVCDIALGMAAIDSGNFPDGDVYARACDNDVLLAAALFHDLLKIEEYEIHDFTSEGLKGFSGRHLVRNDDATGSNVWVGTSYQKNIGHICGSAAQFQCTATSFGVSRKTIDAVVHCILAHHGRREWGSPVEPQTLEALILHNSGLLSAQFGKTKGIPI